MRRVIATVLAAAAVVAATATTAHAGTPPVGSLRTTSSYVGQGRCEVMFAWTSPRTDVDHFEYLLTDAAPNPSTDWQHSARATSNLAVKRTVFRGAGVWLTLAAVFADGTTSTTVQAGRDAVTC